MTLKAVKGKISAVAFIAAVSSFPVWTTSAMAQGTTSPVNRDNQSCPTGWRSSSSGENIKFCYPRSSSSKPIYLKQRNVACAPGYGPDGSWCREGAPVPKTSSTSSSSSSASTSAAPQSSSSGSSSPSRPVLATKQDKLDRCPVGMYTEGDGLQCFSRLPNPAIARTKGDAPCLPGEVNEYDLWCTSNYEHFTRDQITGALITDFNVIYMRNGRVGPKQLQDKDWTKAPVYVALFGNSSAAATPPTPSESTTTASAATTTPSNPNCPTNAGAAQAGAEIGGALGARSGKGMLGRGLGALAGAAASKGKKGC